MPRIFLVLSLVMVFTVAMFSGARASGCGKDCASKQESQPSSSGCRVMFGSGILYDNGIAISVSAPEGWAIDDKSGVSAGLHAVFYPEGSSWTEADSVMYAEIVHKDTCKNSTLEKVMRKDADEPAESRLMVSVKDGGTLKTTKGRDAQVRLFSGGENKAVAYVDEDKAVARLVVSSRTGEGLEGAMPAFREFVGTYFFVSDDVDLKRNCMGGAGMTYGGKMLEAVGSVSSVEKDGLVAFVPDGSDSAVTVRADSDAVSMLAPGDRVRVAYTEGEPNVATKVLKQHKINKLPKPCVLIH